MRRQSVLSEGIGLGRLLRNDVYSRMRALKDDVSRLEYENNRKASLVEVYVREIDAMRQDLHAVYDKVGELIDNLADLQHDQNGFVREIVRLRWVVMHMGEELRHMQEQPCDTSWRWNAPR